MNQPLLCRSLLHTSALDVARYETARAAGPDIAILDLEDSVPLGSKDAARRAAMTVFRGPSWPECTRGIRMNGIRTEDGIRDVLALRESGAKPDLVLVPRVESAEELRILDTWLGGDLSSVGFVITVETARGATALREIVGACPRIAAIAFGAADFAASTGAAMTWEPLLYVRSQIVVAAAEMGVPAIDTPCFDIDNEPLLLEEIERTRALGFQGKATIHPKHIPALNAGYSPSDAVIGHARAVIARAEAHRDRICVMDGRMIGPPFVLQAREVLRTAGAIRERESLRASIVSCRTASANAG